MSRLFRIAAIFSSVLCLLIVLLWIHGYWRIDQFNWLRPAGKNTVEINVCAACGDVMMARICVRNELIQDAQIKPGFSSPPLTSSTDLAGYVDAVRDSDDPPALVWSFRFAGSAGYAERDQSGADWMVVVPLWFPAMLTAILPLVFVFRLRKARRRARKGLCPRCGYDLRASPERCPECGRLSPSVTPPATTPASQ